MQTINPKFNRSLRVALIAVAITISGILGAHRVALSDQPGWYHDEKFCAGGAFCFTGGCACWDTSPCFCYPGCTICGCQDWIRTCPGGPIN